MPRQAVNNGLIWAWCGGITAGRRPGGPVPAGCLGFLKAVRIRL